MNTRQIDLLNIALIIVSLILAFYLPFQLFIFAYAILGPLHYLTEINWLHERKYFINDRKWIWVVAVFALIFTIPFLLDIPFVAKIIGNSVVQDNIKKMSTWINALVLLAFVLAIGLVYFRKSLHRMILFAVGIILAILLNGSLTYNIWIGIFLPTIIHVYVLYTPVYALWHLTVTK